MYILFWSFLLHVQRMHTLLSWRRRLRGAKGALVPVISEALYWGGEGGWMDDTTLAQTKRIYISIN